MNNEQFIKDNKLDISRACPEGAIDAANRILNGVTGWAEGEVT